MDAVLDRAKRALAWPLGIGTMLFLLCWATGRLSPHLVNDSPSYLEYSFSNAVEIARQTRPPAYPAFLKLVAMLTPNRDIALTVVLGCQLLLHTIAAATLGRELAAWSVPKVASLAAAIAVAVGCTFWDHGDTISTDAAGMSVGVLAAVAIMRAWRLNLTPGRVFLISGWILLAIAIRPAYLFLIPWSVVMLAVGPRPGGDGWRWTRVLAVGALPCLVLMAWCGFRFWSVGDFGLLPFGHQNMAAVTTQLLDSDELRALPGQAGALGREIARRRVEVARRLPTQLDPDAQDGLDLRPRADVEWRAPTYMTIENRWDAMTYFVVIPAAAAVTGSDSTAQHRALADLDQVIVREYPLRYLRWWLLAIRRGIAAGVADIAQHPIFLPLGCLLAGWAVVRAIGMSSPSVSTEPGPWRCLRPLVLVAITYGFAKVAFVGLTSPAIGRFSDAAWVFVPAWWAAAAMIWLRHRTPAINRHPRESSVQRMSGELPG